MTDDIYNQETLDYLLQTDLSSFFEQSFSIFEASDDYLHSWYIDLLCEYLQEFARNPDFKRLNINMPPRFAKSALCNVSFSMWVMGNMPEKKIITASFSATLSQKLHGLARSIAKTRWYKRAFPSFNIDNNAKLEDQVETKNTQSQFITTEGGFRIATSTNGSITGSGGHIIIADDLMNPEEAMSITQNESAIDWIRGTLFSRFDNKKTGKFLNIQQRLKENDFTGTFVDSSWENVIVPIRARHDIKYHFMGFKKDFNEGEWLEPRRYGEDELKDDIKNMGTKNVEAQYFQNPFPDDGEIFKREYFKYWLFLPKMDYLAIYADTASKEGRENDYTVFQCWGLLHKNGRKFAYLLDILRDKLTTPKLLATAKEFWLKHYHNEENAPLIKFAIEDKSSGIGLIQLLESETNIPVTKLIPEKDKVARANDILPRMESGQVLFKRDAPWLGTLEKELLLFSAKKNNNKKDQVDTLTYAVKDLLFDPIDEKESPMDYSGLINEVNKYER
jgi:predicted phage terminase large subunit-like protein